MKKYIVISDEVLESVLARLAEGKYVEGTLHRDKWTGKLCKEYRLCFTGKDCIGII